MLNHSVYTRYFQRKITLLDSFSLFSFYNIFIFDIWLGRRIFKLSRVAVMDFQNLYIGPELSYQIAFYQITF